MTEHKVKSITRSVAESKSEYAAKNMSEGKSECAAKNTANSVTEYAKKTAAKTAVKTVLLRVLLGLAFLFMVSCPVSGEAVSEAVGEAAREAGGGAASEAGVKAVGEAGVEAAREAAGPQAVSQTDSGEKEYCILSFINIGKGDAFVLTVPQDRHYMIDTGKKSDDEIVGQFLEEKGITHLDGVFLSHGHKDHAGGLKKLLKNGITVDKVYTSAVDTVSYKDFNLEKLRDKYKFTHELLDTDDVVALSESESDAWLQVLGPQQPDPDNENNNSMIMMINYKDTRFLMMGDAELEEETLLAVSGAELSADVLKTGHHGKNDATGSEFLQMVKPSYAILTGSRYEDMESASQKVIARLRAEGIREYVSEGDFLAVDFVSDGETVTPAEFSKIR